MRVTIFDYGAGNLHSLAKALVSPGVAVHVDTDTERAINTDILVLPGVGAFGAAATAVGGLRDAVAAGLPTVGICLGMQLLFSASDEGPGEGLGVIPGRVRRICSRRVPHMGWNTLSTGETMYFAHSYVCEPEDLTTVASWTEQDGDRFPAVVRSHHVVGVQFHPEKSTTAGVRFLRALITGEASR